MTKTDTGLHAALLAARASFKPIQKDAVNTFLKGAPKYATLDAVLDGVESALATQQINVLQKPAMIDGKPYLLTTLHHVPSGQEETGTYPLPEGADPQRFGAAITYARRYSLPPMLGVTAEEDTDGESAKPVERKPAQQSAPKQERQAPPPKDADPNDPERGLKGYLSCLDRVKKMGEAFGERDVLERIVAQSALELTNDWSDPKKIASPRPFVMKSLFMANGAIFDKANNSASNIPQSLVDTVNALLDDIEAGLDDEIPF